MKKEYEAPKAEKVEFNYSEVVVASGCRNQTHYEDSAQEGPHCSSSQPYYSKSDEA
ncbi:MAG: hypothetical protein IKG87_01505 [Clostridia bacterium]|nr:hypothetical protein [Clostridia bacterium]MBR4576584.1 hypothetical protein [Clostridia bacterium]